MAGYIIKIAGAGFAVLLLAGCQSREATYYTSPQVTGRVLDVNTRQPLAEVQVGRIAAGNNFQPFGPPKGGQIISEQNLGVQTDADGRFTLPAKSSFALFRKPGWWTVTIFCEHSGYELFQTNYTADNLAANSTNGPPVVNAGNILLQPITP